MKQFTQLLYEVKKEVDDKINRMTSLYQQALDDYEVDMIKFSQNPYGESPQSPIEPKPLVLTRDDYNIKESIIYIDTNEIVTISKSSIGDTIIMFKNSERITVKESVEDVFNIVKS